MVVVQRGDIDLAAATLSVKRQIVYLKDGSRLETKPKSAAGVRTVSLPPFVLNEFTPPKATANVLGGKQGAPLGHSTPQASIRYQHAARTP